MRTTTRRRIQDREKSGTFRTQVICKLISSLPLNNNSPAFARHHPRGTQRGQKPLMQRGHDFAGSRVRRNPASALPSAAAGTPRAEAQGQQQQLWEDAMEPTPPTNEPSHELANDLLRGADEIAEFIFGARGSRRKIYYLAETSHLPVFRLGSMLCARRSVIERWIAGQECRVRPRGE